MEKIKNSLKQRPVNGVLMVLTAVLYLMNNIVFKNIGDGIFRVFFIGYFNDLICPLFILPYSNVLLLTVGKELKKLPYILLICLAGSLLWEFIAPMYKPGAVTDILDIVCYLAGGVVYWIILKVWSGTEAPRID